MTEKQIIFKEKEQQESGESIDIQKANAQAVSQLDAILRANKKVSRLKSLRITTDGIETQVSKQKKTPQLRESKAGNSIDV